MTARRVAAITAIVAWAALVLQFGLMVARMVGEGAGLGFAVWRFLGYFAILTNLAVATVATAAALRPAGRCAGPRVRFAVAVAITVVGIVYSVALRELWDPTGWQAVADHALHDATPLLFALFWLLSPHGGIGWSDLPRALVAPIGYCLYAFARGAADGWYAYWFLDPTAASLGRLAASIAVLVAVFLTVAALFATLDRLLTRRRDGRQSSVSSPPSA